MKAELASFIVSLLLCCTSALCPSEPGCSYQRKEHRLICRGGLQTAFNSDKVRQLVLCSWPENRFEARPVQRLYPRLRGLLLTDSNVSTLGSFARADGHLQVLNFTGLRLTEISELSLAALPQLRVLDLRNNSLGTISSTLLEIIPSLQMVYLADNPWDCSEDLRWLLTARRVVDRELLLCGKDFAWSPLLAVMQIKQTLWEQCVPENCTCDLWYISRSPTTGLLVPQVVVNCSGRGLHQLPAALPPNTTILHLQENQIRDVSALADARRFAGVTDVYLDWNAVESVEALEGAAWLQHFRVLSLRANRLRRLPTHALENALERNKRAARLFLGANPWRCDCLFTPNFQDLLMKYKRIIVDVADIKCGNPVDEENQELEIINLPRRAVCRETSHSDIQPLDLLNGVLATLIVLVLAKLGYDYWNFKRTGRVPWLVTKMP